MICPKCKKVIDNDSLFCEYCGEKIISKESSNETSSSKNKKGLWITLVILVLIVLLYVGGNRIYVYHDQIYKDWIRENDRDFIDLGLPSGTLWAADNEGGDYVRYSYYESVSRFGNKLPTKKQLEELKNQCTWTWTGSGYKVIGPNGNSIYFPAPGFRYSNTFSASGVGYCGYFWSMDKSMEMTYDSEYAYYLYFDIGGIRLSSNRFDVCQTVRLVKD